MRYSEILLYGVYSDLQTEVSRRFLGFLWWGIEPVLYMTTFYLVFGLALKQGEENYVLFLLTGLIAWKWFDGSVRLASIAINSNAGLAQQIYIPKYIFPLIPILSNTFKFLIVLAMLLGFLLLAGSSASWLWLGILPVMVCELILIISIGLLLAAIVPFAQDLKQIIDNLLTLLMFGSGIFFTPEHISERIKPLFEYNPMFLLISSYRNILLYNNSPRWDDLGYSILVSIPIFCTAYFLLLRFDRHYPKLMM